MDKIDDRPVPIVDHAPTTEALKAIRFSKSDPRSLEQLVDLRKLSIAGQNYYARKDGANFPYGERIQGAIPDLLARESVARMLQHVNRTLEIFDLELFLYDAYRPIECQLGIWNFFWRDLGRKHPELNEVQLERQVRTYVSDPRAFDPNIPETWPLHSSGGAVDVTLRKRSTGELLDLGTHFDDASQTAHTDFFERQLAEKRVGQGDLYLRNRRILYWSMRLAGFTNYSYEFWHYDFGDRMYALIARTAATPDIEAFYPHVAI